MGVSFDTTEEAVADFRLAAGTAELCECEWVPALLAPICLPIWVKEWKPIWRGDRLVGYLLRYI